MGVLALFFLVGSASKELVDQVIGIVMIVLTFLTSNSARLLEQHGSLCLRDRLLLIKSNVVPCTGGRLLGTYRRLSGLVAGCLTEITSSYLVPVRIAWGQICP